VDARRPEEDYHLTTAQKDYFLALCNSYTEIPELFACLDSNPERRAQNVEKLVRGEFEKTRAREIDEMWFADIPPFLKRAIMDDEDDLVQTHTRTP
jgi:hypothetical protein